jgi:hypothetical protein
MGNEPIPTEIEHGSITAPAGCGKTHLVAKAIANHDESKLPLLVLTHTNAGVAALRKRVARLGANQKQARISTLDGWSLRLLKAFPLRSEIDPIHLELGNPKVDYPKIREGALNIILNDHIGGLIKATYSHLVVDEYQDCQPDQHQLIVGLSRYLPTCVLGDPLQSIFNFTVEGTVDWENEVLEEFPSSGELVEPWRWRLSGNEELGEWLLEIRRQLLAGNQIDLRHSPGCVEWVHLDGEDDWAKQLRAANTRSDQADGASLIMAKWPRDQAEYARKIPGASKVENADLSELQKFAASFELEAERPLVPLINFASSVMTGIDRNAMRSRLQSIQQKTNRNPPTPSESAILAFVDNPTYSNAARILSELSAETGVRVFRPELLRTALKTLNSTDSDNPDALIELALSIRDQMRVTGRHIPKKAVGSTLLFKGLEADVSIILQTEQMDFRDLYVALTRGSRKIVICSTSPLVPIQ